MAYLNLLMSVPTSELDALRADSLYVAKYTELTAVSHLLAYWIKTQPLGDLLGKAIDGGETINDELWHPLRNPVFHNPTEVAELHREITAEWTRISPDKQRAEPFDFFGPEIEKLLSVFRHASANGECVVSVLDTPADKERADRVKFPSQRFDSAKRSSLPSILGLAAVGLSLVLSVCLWRYRRLAMKHDARMDAPNDVESP